jgi:hypothetical protein
MQIGFQAQTNPGIQNGPRTTLPRAQPVLLINKQFEPGRSAYAREGYAHALASGSEQLISRQSAMMAHQPDYISLCPSCPW